MKEYVKSLLSRLFVAGILPFVILVQSESGFMGWLITFLILTILCSYWVYSSDFGDKDKKHEKEILDLKQKAQAEISKIKKEAQYEISSTIQKAQREVSEMKSKLETGLAESSQLIEKAQRNEQLWKKTMLERNSGFNTLLQFIRYFEKLRDEPVSNYLDNKKHPAHTAADKVREEAKRRREADFQNKRTQALIEMYEQYAPFLIELKDDIPDIEDLSIFEEYSEEERQDAVINYLRKDEYRKLSAEERNQLALDRFWDRPKSKWLIGKLYERYIGFLYEQKGYEVNYFGIDKRYEDMGRDLICHKGDETLIIQCKNWAEFKTIYEKHIFQLFGTLFEYKERHPNKKVKGIFYTTTKLSDLARKIATTLGIELFEEFKLDRNYPCIKCNISTQNGEKIYHLPFDQKYDDTKIDRNGEMYCAKVKEAETAGFRRAFRWSGSNDS